MFEGTRILAVSVIGLCAATLLYSQSNETKQNSADLLRTFKTIYVQSKTPLANRRCSPVNYRRTQASMLGDFLLRAILELT